MYSTLNESKSVFAERFLRTLKSKIYKKLKANDSKSYLGHLNKLIEKYNESYHHCIGKKPVDVDDSPLTEKNKPTRKATKFKVCDRIRITKYNNILYKKIFYWYCAKN